MTSLPTTNGASTEDQKWAEIQAAFAPSFWSKPHAMNDSKRGFLLREYRIGIECHLAKGSTTEDAKARALQAITQVWSISTVTDMSGLPSLMPLPPEKVYAGQTINGSYGWIREQAEETLLRYLVETDRRKRTDAKVPFQLIPATRALSRWREGRSISYEILYWDNRGLLQTAVGVRFAPNYEAAKAKADVIH